MDTIKDIFKDNRIIELLEKCSYSLSSSEIQTKLKSKVHPKALQRHLNSLIEHGIIEKHGKGRGTKYSIKKSQSKKINNILEIPPDEDYSKYITLSTNSINILKYIKQPLESRGIVSYSRDLLDSYIPNKTYYLPEEVRAELKRHANLGNDNLPAGTYGTDLLNRFLIDLSFASSKLEGNTYTYLETKKLIEEQDSFDNKSPFETQMILNHKRAIKFMIDNIADIKYDKYNFFNLHALLADGLLADSKFIGRVRNFIVTIGQSNYKPMAIPQVLEECLEIILQKTEKIVDPIEQAFFIMVHVPYLQAFMDVNKRVSRLGANISLLKNNLCPITFIGIPEQAYTDAYRALYETQDYSLLIDVFKYTYKSSVQKYKEIGEQHFVPDVRRIKYQGNIHKAVNQIVLNLVDDYKNILNDFAKTKIPEQDREFFITEVTEALDNIHPGVLALYNLSIDDFKKWSSR